MSGNRGTQFALGDVIAGLSVACVLIPQSLAYAGLAGMPPVYGLYAATLPLLVAAVFGSSPFLQTGPVAITSVLTAAALSPLATPESAHYIALAPLLALVVGIARIGCGLAGAGFIAYLISQPVLLGFTSGAVLLIIASQLPALVGVSGMGSTVERALWVVTHAADWSYPALTLGLVTIALTLGARRVHALFPGVLVAIVGGIALTECGVYAGPTVGFVPAGWPAIGIDFAWADLRHLILPGLVIAFVGFAEPAAIARALSTQERLPWDAERELVGQGAANVAAAVCGAFPVGGSFSRTALAHNAGARSRASGAITGVLVLALLPWADWLAGLPRAVLAGVIIAAVVKLVRVHELIALIAISRAQALVGASALFLTLALAPRVDVALLISIGLGIAVHLWRETRIVVIARHDGDTRTLTLELIGVLYFGSAQSLYDALIAELAHDRDVIRINIDLRRLGRVDYTGAMALHRVASDVAAAGLAVTIIPGVQPQGERLLRRVFGAGSPWIAPG